MIQFNDAATNYYTIAALVGGVLTFVVYALLSRTKHGNSWLSIVGEFLFALVGLVIGAHLLFFIVGLPDWILQYSGQIHSISDFFTAFINGASGLVFYGGLLGAIFGIWFYSKYNHLYLKSELNTAVVVFPLFHFFGRVGCTLTGCCYGIEYHGIFSLLYSADYAVAGKSDDIADFSRFPIQPLEALLELALFIVLLIIYIKKEDKYSLTCIYLLAYAVIRFLDEFLRGDSVRGIWGPFSTSQWISLVIIICVVIYLAVKKPWIERRMYEGLH